MTALALVHEASHRERARLLLASGYALSEWERDFLASIAARFMLTDKQLSKLERIEARVGGEPIDPKAAFLDAMEAAGIKPDEPIADRLGPDKIRFRCEGDSKGRRNGWARFYDDGLPAGSFGSYKLQIAERWHLDDGRDLSPEERKRLAAECRERDAQRAAERLALHTSIAAECQAVWEAAGPVDPAHGYLIRKRIDGEGLRQSGACLLVPMLDDQGTMWNLQRIRPNGTKLFAKDARATGLHMLIGDPGTVICLAEGYGTGAAIRRATGHAVAVAFSASNLRATALTMQARYPDAGFVICADDDAHLINHPTIKKNLGVEAAEDAARAVGGRIAMPPRERIPHD